MGVQDRALKLYPAIRFRSSCGKSVKYRFYRILCLRFSGWELLFL